VAAGPPRLQDVGSPSRTYAGGGHGELRVQASPDDPGEVARWAEAHLRAAVQPGDEVAVLGHWSWVLRRRSAGYLQVWGVSVEPAAAGPGLPPGTRCVVTWSSGSFPEAPRT
jgi:hypothetical protein